MQELIQSLEEKTGLSPDKAKEAVSHVLDFLKSKLPDSLHQHIDNAVNSQSSSGALGGIESKLGGMFGN